ncbi:MAG: ABC transporter ATP-binding protein [Flavobacteriales bacterium]
MIQTDSITKSYDQLQVLKGVSLTINTGEIVAIVGPSGAGKSTLLHILGTLDLPDSGRVLFNGEEVSKKGKNDLAKFRNKHIGFVFQFHHLLPEFTALENVCLPAMVAGMSKMEMEKKAKELLELLRLAERIHHKPNELSGGEQQRVAVARALINNPKAVFADEPSGNLDAENAKALHNLFFELREKMGQSFVIVTHNEELANMADRKLVMKDGVIVG